MSWDWRRGKRRLVGGDFQCIIIALIPLALRRVKFQPIRGLRCAAVWIVADGNSLFRSWNQTPILHCAFLVALGLVWEITMAAPTSVRARVRLSDDSLTGVAIRALAM